MVNDSPTFNPVRERNGTHLTLPTRCDKPERSTQP